MAAESRTEILHKRNERSKTFDLGNGKFQLVAHCKPIHYVNKSTQDWDDIDLTFNDTGDDFISDKNKVSVGFRKDGLAHKMVGFRYDYEHQLEYTLLSVELDGVEQVTKVDGFSPSKANDFRIDHTLPSGVKLFSEINEVSTRMFTQVDTPIKDFRIVEEVHLKGFHCSNEKEANTYLVDGTGRFNFVNDDTGELAFWIVPPYFRDSQNRVFRGVTHTLEEIDGKLIYTKFPNEQGKDDLLLSTFPIFIDADTFYAPTTDGDIRNLVYSDWTTCRNAETGEEAFPDDVYGFVARAQEEKGTYICHRGYFMFDTSTIGSGQVVTAASLHLHGHFVGTPDAGHICVQKGTHGDTLTVEDYDAFTGVYYAKKTGWNNTAYNEFVFNATGMGDVEMEGTTYVVAREYDHDYIETDVSDEDHYRGIDYAEQTGLTKDPKLVVTYEASGTDHEKELSDSISIAEAKAKAVTKPAIADALSIAESSIQERGLYSILSDAITLAEAVANKSTLGASDAITFAESQVAVNEFYRALADTLSIAEAEVEETVKALTDTLSITESLANVTTLGLSDSQILADSPATTNEFYRSLADVVVLADAEVEEFVKSLSDTLSISEGLAKGVGKAISDTQSMAEALLTKPGKILADAITFAVTIDDFEVGKGLSDSLTPVDSLARTVEYYLDLSDEHFIADATGIDVSIPLADVVTFTEAVSLEPQPRPSDTITFVEEISVFDSVKVLTDAQSIAEAVVFGVNLVKSDSTIIEVVITSKTIVVNLSDVLTIVESEVEKEALGAVLSDSLSIAESLAKTVVAVKTDVCDLYSEIAKSVTKPLTETVAITESVAGRTTLNLSDSIPIVESVQTTGFQTLVDSIGITESLTKDIVHVLADILAISESLVTEYIIPLVESLPISEQLGNSASLALSEAMPIVEDLIRVNEFYRTPVDSQSITEAEVKTITKALTDSIAILDSEVEKEVEHLEDSIQPFVEETVKTIVKNLTESLSIADSEVGVVSLVLSDVISISEGVVAEKGFERFLGDSVAFSEGLIWEFGLFKAETLAITETLANQTTLSLADSVSIVESEIEAVEKPALADAISITEEIAKTLVKNLSDSLPIADSEIEAIFLNFADAISCTESLEKTITQGPTDTLSITESLAIGQSIVLGDSVTISEAFGSQVDFVRELSDLIPMVDSGITVSATTLADSISISESIVLKPAKGLTESVGLKEEFSTDWLFSHRLTQQTFLRTIADNRERRTLIRSKYQH
ncbi:MAG: hypothetical protein KAS32_13065 [Candidatus Peribacteraceae bacterium]|nr:hypothetical protein [Candidatus Peribacteraceae bacterium]